ncbi:Uma2 family endonuclease [Thermoactinospora rubra]|uniref:Uma2 family endonuclease n=1 Tax=Thermoactinospora rubra TaxID=1088767 RepID=UPI000A11F59C|nr:Uma2 family endonuclease [Thermoactinospora rubra]
MSALPLWATDPYSLLLAQEQYDALPEEVRRSIEVLDGVVVLCRSGIRRHDQVRRRLANLIEAALPEDSCLEVVAGHEMHFSKRRFDDGRLSFRRPDVAVHRRLDRHSKLTAADVVMVAEIVPPGFQYVAPVDKKAEYAYEGIPLYLIVYLDDDLFVDIVQEYRLDWASRSYRLAETHRKELVLDQPLPVTIPFKDLDG